jgi:GT2 family glycosyltransferase
MLEGIVPVTVVVPVRNEVITLPELFDALEYLTTKPAEIIFVDTGSVDASVAAIQNWSGKAERVGMSCRVLELQDGYPGAARNAGVMAATQAWIAFLDAGIIPSVNWLASLWTCQKKSRNNAYYGVCRFTPSGNAVGKIICALSYGCDRVLPVLPASLFHRDLFYRVAFFEPTLRAGEDILWQRTLRSAGVPIEICPNAVVEYRHFPQSVSQAARKWFVYERSASVAGIGGGFRLLALLCVVMVFAGVLVVPATGALGVSVYAVSRGIIDPLRRANWRAWWGRQPWMLLAAVPMAAVLDFAAAAGRIAGLMRGKRFR